MLHRPNRPGRNGRPGKGSNAVAVWSPQLVFISRYLVRVRFPAPSILAWSERQYVSESPIYPFGPVSIELFRSNTNAGLSTFAQCLPKPGKQIKVVQTIFNVSNIMNATGLGFLAARSAMNGNLLDPSLLIGLAGVTFFLAETLPVAAVISLTEHKSTAKIWRELFVLTSPYFFLSAGVAATAVAALQHAGWSIPTLTLILMYSTYRSFRAYFHPLVGVPVPSGARSMSAAAGR